MIRCLGKYVYALSTGVQMNLAYRVNFIARAVFGLLPTAAIIAVWKTVYLGHGTDSAVASYSLREMITYYLVVAVANMLVSVHDDDWQIARDIREGNINYFLVKPLDYLWFRFWMFLSGRIAYTAVAVWPIGMFVLLFSGDLEWSGTPATLALSCLSFLLSAFLQFLISFAVAMLAFWVLEVSTFIFIVFAFEFIASGQLFPLDLLPGGIREVLMFSPFPYEMYFPVAIFTGKVDGPDLMRGIIVQCIWVLVMYVVARFALNMGLKKYSAYGG